MASNILSDDVALEVQALARRTCWIRRAGISLSVMGGLAAAVGIAGTLISQVFLPTIKGFEFDFPASALSSESSFQDTFGQFGSNLGAIIDGPLFYVSSAMSICYLLFMFGKIVRGEFDSIQVPMVMAALVLAAAPKAMGFLIGDTEGDSQVSDAHNRIERFIDADEYTQLINYLKSSNSKAQPGFLPFDYVVAQAGVKEDKPDVPVIKRVVEGYNTIKPFATVPGPVRYALEMTAFNDVVTDGAKLYQANQLSKSAYLSETGKQGGLTGSGLLLLGAGILLWFRQMSRRVNFLKSSLSI